MIRCWLRLWVWRWWDRVLLRLRLEQSLTTDAEQTIAIIMVNQLEARIIGAAHLAVHIVWEQSMYCWITFKFRFFFRLVVIARRFPISCNDVIIVIDTSFLYMA